MGRDEPRLYRWRWLLLGTYALVLAWLTYPLVTPGWAHPRFYAWLPDPALSIIEMNVWLTPLSWPLSLAAEALYPWRPGWVPERAVEVLTGLLHLMGFLAVQALALSPWRRLGTNLAQPVPRRRTRVAVALASSLVSIGVLGILFDVALWGQPLQHDLVRRIYTKHAMGAQLGVPAFIATGVVALGSVPLAWLTWRWWVGADHLAQWRRVLRRLALAGAGLVVIGAAGLGLVLVMPKGVNTPDGLGFGTAVICGAALVLWTWGVALGILFAWRQFERAPHIPYCPHCGYDLRGMVLVPHASCPECGAEVSADIPAVKG